MHIARLIASVLLYLFGLFVFLYFVISVCVAFFIFSGTLSIGQPMFFDITTPSWHALLLFQFGCVVVMSAAFILGAKLARVSRQARARGSEA
jgi:hypothetical protein